MIFVIIFSVEPVLKATSTPPSSVSLTFGLMVIVGALWTITSTLASNEQYSPINRITYSPDRSFSVLEIPLNRNRFFSWGLETKSEKLDFIRKLNYLDYFLMT